MAQVPRIPKAELHVHLEGTMRPALTRALAARNGLVLPKTLFTPDGHYRWTDFLDFLRAYDAVAAVIRTPEDYRDVTRDYLLACAAEGAIYVEDTRGSMFQTRAPIDAMAGDPIRWARIDGNRLGVFSMVVMPDGRYELQAYERLLTDVGLDIDFRRILDGQVVRLIEGRTVRVN